MRKVAARQGLIRTNRIKFRALGSETMKVALNSSLRNKSSIAQKTLLLNDDMGVPVLNIAGKGIPPDSNERHVKENEKGDWKGKMKSGNG